MRVETVETAIVEVPLPTPIGTAIHAIRSVGCLVVTVRTADGVSGQSHLFTINGDRLSSFDEMVRGLADSFVVGRDPRYSEGIWHDVWAAINPTGHAGVTVAALSTLDMACWDAVGRALDTPLYQLFGACRDRVDVYASSGLWLSASIDELKSEAAAFAEAGFRAMKIRVGSPDSAIDEARVAAVRQVIGNDVKLLADVNQGLRPAEAIRLGRRLDAYNLQWLEEPVATYDRAGHARVRHAIATPIASGETEYTRFGCREMLDAGAVDVFMPDLQRIGGFSEFRKAAALCAANNVGVSSHFFTELSLTMAGSIAACDLVEHVDWFAPLYNESMEMVDGQLVIPERPGTGFTYNVEP